MKNFITRSISAFWFAGTLIFCILFHKLTFIGLFLILMLFCIYEFNRLINLKSMFPYIIGVMMFVFGNIFNVEELPYIGLFRYAGVLLFLTIFVTFVSILFYKKEEVVNHLGKIFLSVIYIAVPFTLIAQIPFLNSNIQYVNTTILGVFLLIWINDTFAYIIGSNIGKHKLLERISPNKTIEGFIGGMIAAFIGSYFLSLYFDSLTSNQWFVIAFIVSTFGVLGDLIESMFKRQAGVKDSGDFIPG
ncbi:MAG: phosphatidate cytidylyltransferase, partial [Flavobacteriaceae bacterium]|nr:phosphatidate cytidylyltransferase [Flavobacteriaceae bacterium]